MKTIHPTNCACERKLLEAIDDLQDKGTRSPRLMERYTASANELEKIRRSHFSDCLVCRLEESAGGSETE